MLCKDTCADVFPPLSTNSTACTSFTCISESTHRHTCWSLDTLSRMIIGWCKTGRHAQKESRQRDTCLCTPKWSVTMLHLWSRGLVGGLLWGLTAGGRCDNLMWTSLINHCVVTLALVSVYVSTNWNPTGTRLRQSCTLAPPTISSRWGELRWLAPIGHPRLAVLSLPAEGESHGHV